MAMELEYPFKMVLYMFVVAVIVGILITFRSKFINMCFLPPCEKDNRQCSIEVIRIKENNLNEDIVNKYYDLCYQKSKDCQKDIFCYIISLDLSINPTSLHPECLNKGKCDITCNKDVNMVYIFYKWPENKIEIGC